MEFENEDEKNLFLSFLEDDLFYKKFIKDLMNTNEVEKKKDILRKFLKYFDAKSEIKPNTPLTNLDFNIHKKLFVSMRQMKGNTPFMWDYMVNNSHLWNILNHCCDFFEVNPYHNEDFYKETAPDSLFEELGFYEKNISLDKIKEVYKKLIGEEYKPKKQND